MAERKESALATRGTRDPFALLRQMTTELDRAFDEPFFGLRWPALGTLDIAPSTWAPRVDVFERDGRLITKVDLPGVKKEDVTVQVTDGHLALSGERKQESAETKDNVYRTEREYGSFSRVVPLPQGVKLEDVQATFAEGVLEVSIPIPTQPEAKVRKVEIQEPGKASKTAA